MDEDLVTLQISAEYREKLRRLADQRKRSMKREFEWIIDEEEARRFSQPNTTVTIEQAIEVQ
jgi:hypothetical protein